MTNARLDALEKDSLTGIVFGMFIGCPHGCGKACPFYAVQQFDLATTFFYIKTLSRADKIWLIQRYENCPVRLGLDPGERRGHPRHANSRGFDRNIQSSV